MPNIQLLLSIGIPSLLIVVAMLNSNSRLNGIGSRVDKRFEGIEKRLDGIDRRLDHHDERFEDLKAAGHKDALEIMRQMTSLHERVAVVEAREAK